MTENNEAPGGEAPDRAKRDGGKRAEGKRDGLFVRFWGVRGSIACPGPRFARYGGNTSCIEVRVGGRLLVFDAGSGLKPLGDELVAEAPLDADLFLSHTHVDHIQGLPFFAPNFDRRNRFRVWAAHLQGGIKLRDVLCKYMAAPLFPVPPDIFAAEVDYRDFAVGEVLSPAPGATLTTAALNHPNGATGYRLDYQGRSFCYVTDTEHVEGQADESILRLIEGADAVVYDSTYGDEEYHRYRGWGHSTWQEALRLADQAAVKRMILFHHDPGHDDEKMDAVAAAAEKARPGTLVAREGMELTL